MGKQITFYMLESDEQQFEQFVRSLADAVLLGFASTDGEPNILQRFPVDDTLTTRYRTVFLWKAHFPLFLREVVMATGPLRGRPIHYVDASQSSVIEISRSVLLQQENVLTRGRLWAELCRQEGDQLVDKGEAFRQLYDSLATWVRKHCRRLEAPHGYYAGAQAYEWYQSGGKLQP